MNVCCTHHCLLVLFKFKDRATFLAYCCRIFHFQHLRIPFISLNVCTPTAVVAVRYTGMVRSLLSSSGSSQGKNVPVGPESSVGVMKWVISMPTWPDLWSGPGQTMLSGPLPPETGFDKIVRCTRTYRYKHTEY
jgi:hypothetical protein